ncbi:WD repeat-containing protein 26 homolog [Phragmites australis]|uniref:WD repeat-containing protein 26 homolog n=1 Tax=Phragmites australis TaxID=29695 RepID=UPI002D7915AE|nr:WD repeat-containing protein 26 homolog [Phragmites australis]XP_062195460.1 WD repeat-containing protein 26 homolog [Phragmites australis]XP_062195461.1 WD repeat-containing protein 26 homolog [Phragmites australis]XP_062195462.1 WD repeat-containing protein 26 homolog [Phragmites australis]
MGGFEDDEPPSKCARASSVESASLPDCFSFSKSANPLGSTMARPLPSQGKEVMVGSKGVIKREEFVRIITKTLYSLGYGKSGAVLEEESGITLHTPMVNLFRKQVVDGKWDNAVVTLNKIGLLDENIVKSAAFLILEQKFFELLRNDNVLGAMKSLQSEITPLGVNRKRVHELSSCIISCSPQQVFVGFSKLGIDSSSSRQKLLEDLQKVLPPTVMVPERRLENLVEQALTVQRDACYFHNSIDGLSLYIDHHCGKDQIPSRTLQVLRAHHDEVWFLQFSNNGKYLASASNDKSAIIWEVDEDGELLLKHTLSGHEKSVMMVAWSPDDRQLLTCGMEETIRRWDVESGKCLHVYEKPGIGLISCAWFPNGKQILSGLTNQNFCIWDLHGKEVDSWNGQRSSKTSDFAVAKDGKLIISMNRECTIILFDRETKQERLIEEDHTITSFSLSEDGDFLLVNLTSEEIHLWNIRNGPIRVNRYSGHKRSRFVIRSCFGGSEQAFIASGSEDSQVYIWHRATGDLIETLPGHSGTVNCVSWNPANPHMLASASDDHTIRIWGVKKAGLKRKDVGSSNGIHANGNAHGNGFVHQCNGNSSK